MPLPFVFLECITPYVTGTLRHGTNNFSALYSLLEKLGHAYGCCHGIGRRGHMTVCSMALYTAPRACPLHHERAKVIGHADE